MDQSATKCLSALYRAGEEGLSGICRKKERCFKKACYNYEYCMSFPRNFVYRIAWIVYDDLSSGARKNTSIQFWERGVLAIFFSTLFQTIMNKTPYICGSHSLHPPRIQRWIEPGIHNIFCHSLLSWIVIQSFTTFPRHLFIFFAITKRFLMFSLVEIYVLWDRGKCRGI